MSRVLTIKRLRCGHQTKLTTTEKKLYMDQIWKGRTSVWLNSYQEYIYCSVVWFSMPVKNLCTFVHLKKVKKSRQKFDFLRDIIAINWGVFQTCLWQKSCSCYQIYPIYEFMNWMNVSLSCPPYQVFHFGNSTW